MRLPIRQIRATDLFAIILPVTVVAVLSAILLAKVAVLLFGSPPDPVLALDYYRATLIPKPLQEFRYILLLPLFPLFLAAGLFALTRFRKTFRVATRALIIRYMIAASQIALILFIVGNTAYQESTIPASLRAVDPSLAIPFFTFLAAIAIVYGVLSSPRDSLHRWRISNPVAIGVAAVASILNLFMCIVPEWNFYATPYNLQVHMPYVFDEFASVANGRTLSVDFFTQYQQLLPYLFIPVFKIFGMSITTFSVGMTTLSGVMIGFVYAIVRRISDHPEVALLLFLSWLGVAFYPIEILGPSRYLGFTYYAAAPLRFFGFWSVAYFALRTATGTRSFPKQFACLLFASLAAFNSLDFGIHGLVAATVILLLYTPDLKRTALSFVSAFLTAIVVYISIPLIRTGSLPDVANGLSYLRAGTKFGYTALDTPNWGIHLIFILGLLSSLAVGATRWWTSRIHPTADRRSDNLTAAFIFFGIAGSGAFNYFMHRSHWHVLIVIAPIAFFPAILFTTTLFERVQRSGLRYRLNRIPRVLCLISIAGGLAFLQNTPNPIEQWERIKSTHPVYTTIIDSVTAVVKRHSTPGETVGICYPTSQLVTQRAGVNNLFPYPQHGSFILRSHLDVSIRAIEENKIRTLFGNFPSEFAPWMVERGFREIDRYADFKVYRRDVQ